jgi:hypothetical protein
MNENDKILINAYLDGELSNDEVLYVENILDSDIEANSYANKVKASNAKIESFFIGQDFNEINQNIDLFIMENNKNIKKNKNYIEFFNSFLSYKYYGLASMLLLFAVLIPNFNKDINQQFPSYIIPNDRSENGNDNFEEIFNEVVIKYGYSSINNFKLIYKDSVLVVNIKSKENNCFIGVVEKQDTNDIKEFKVCDKEKNSE